MSTAEKDDLFKALAALASLARSEQAAGTRVTSTSESDVTSGLPETVKATLHVTARRSREAAYAAAFRGLDIKPAVTLRKKAKTSWWKWALPSLALPAFATATMLFWAGGQAVSLPVYSMEARGTASVRGDTTNDPFVVRPNTTVQVVLRPASNVTPQIEVQLFWHKDNVLLSWNAKIEVSTTGSVLARGNGDVPWLNEETHGELVAFVGSKGAMKSADIKDISAPPAGVQVLRQAVTWRP